MSERRLIDANAIKYTEYRGGGGRDYPENVVTEYEISRMPTVDVVEVVRCKDCKMLYNYSPVRHFCGITGIPIDEDDFCSYGERRTDEQTD